MVGRSSPLVALILLGCASEAPSRATRAAAITTDLRMLRERLHHGTSTGDLRATPLPLPATFYRHRTQGDAFVFRGGAEPTFLHSAGFAWNVGGHWGVHATFEGSSSSPTGEALRQGVVRQPRGRVDPRESPSPTFGRVVWEAAWPGIDVVAETAGTSFAYSLFVAPGAELGRARFRWDGVEGLDLRDDGRTLVVRAAEHTLTIGNLHAFEVVQGELVERPVRHHVEGTTTTLEVDGWSGRSPLWIDPTVGFWGTYLGGTKKLMPTTATGVVVDSLGNAVVVGATYADDFPVTPGALKTKAVFLPTGLDEFTGFVTKVSPKGELVWSTFLGGRIQDMATGVAIDSKDQVVVVGRTISLDFPLVDPFDGTLEMVAGTYGYDGFVTKLDSGGKLVWSSFLGGSDTNDTRELARAVAIDSSGDITVGGTASSLDFPGLVKPPASPAFAFVSSITSAGKLSWTIPFDYRQNLRVARHPSGASTLFQHDASGPSTPTRISKLGVATTWLALPGQVDAGQAVGEDVRVALVEGAGVGLMGTTRVLSSSGTVGAATNLLPCAPSGSVFTSGGDVAFSCDWYSGFPLVHEWASVGGPYAGAVHRRNLDGTVRFSSCVGTATHSSLLGSWFLIGPQAAAGPTGETYFAFPGAEPGFTGPTGLPSSGMSLNAFLLRVPPSIGADGDACAVDVECKSFHCTEGVCCDKACKGPCEACTAAKKATGPDGTCGPAKADTDPGDRCPAGTTACGPDGLCDGLGKCRAFAKAGSACGTSSCATGVQTDKVCKGDSDSCLETTLSCARYVCGPTTCKSSCGTDDDCSLDSHCSAGGVCVARESNGTGCTNDRACASGMCVDGVCCDSRCEGQCQACDGPVKGTCQAIAGAVHGTRAACGGTGGCQATCDGVDPTGCKYPVGKVCASKCVDDAETLDRCTDAGTCKPGAATSCGAYACAAFGCRDTCTTAADCATGATCTGGKCRGPNPDGTTCSSGVECASGYCVDGVCCGTKCEGQCEACDGATKGVCAAVDGAPHGKRVGCSGKGTCGSRCDGFTRASCTFPSGNVCAASCSAGVESVSTCDGTGTCGKRVDHTCADGCADDRCKGACTKSEDCAAGSTCADGVCVPVAEGGCGCHTGGSAPASAGWLGLSLLAVGAVRRRRARS